MLVLDKGRGGEGSKDEGGGGGEGQRGAGDGQTLPFCNIITESKADYEDLILALAKRRGRERE